MSRLNSGALGCCSRPREDVRLANVTCALVLEIECPSDPFRLSGPLPLFPAPRLALAFALGRRTSWRIDCGCACARIAAVVMREGNEDKRLQLLPCDEGGYQLAESGVLGIGAHDALVEILRVLDALLLCAEAWEATR